MPQPKGDSPVGGGTKKSQKDSNQSKSGKTPSSESSPDLTWAKIPNFEYRSWEILRHGNRMLSGVPKIPTTGTCNKHGQAIPSLKGRTTTLEPHEIRTLMSERLEDRQRDHPEIFYSSGALRGCLKPAYIWVALERNPETGKLYLDEKILDRHCPIWKIIVIYQGDMKAFDQGKPPAHVMTTDKKLTKLKSEDAVSKEKHPMDLNFLINALEPVNLPSIMEKLQLLGELDKNLITDLREINKPVASSNGEATPARASSLPPRRDSEDPSESSDESKPEQISDKEMEEVEPDAESDSEEEEREEEEGPVTNSEIPSQSERNEDNAEPSNSTPTENNESPLLSGPDENIGVEETDTRNGSDTGLAPPITSGQPGLQVESELSHGDIPAANAPSDTVTHTGSTATNKRAREFDQESNPHGAKKVAPKVKKTKRSDTNKAEGRNHNEKT